MNSPLKLWSTSPDDFPADNPAADQLEFMVGYAVLAPSPHNTQPWLFCINGTEVELFADRRRALRVADPAGRELVMSCGAALFNLRIAAEYFGHLYKLDCLPDPVNPDLLARFHLSLHGETSAEDVLLFYAITQRRTNRQPYEDKPVAEEVLRELEEDAHRFGAWFKVVRDQPARQAVADLVAEGDRRQWADKPFRAELAHWIRSPREAHADGLPASIYGIKDWLSFAGSTLIRTFDRGGGLAATDRDIALRAPALGVLGTDSDDPQAWLDAGQALQRVLLGARTDGVWASFLNQPIEIPDLRHELANIIGGAYPQCLLRLGYGPEIPPTPRRSVHQVLVLPQHNVHA